MSLDTLGLPSGVSERETPRKATSGDLLRQLVGRRQGLNISLKPAWMLCRRPEGASAFPGLFPGFDHATPWPCPHISVRGERVIESNSVPESVVELVMRSGHRGRLS